MHLTLSLTLLALAAVPCLSYGIVISPPTRAVGPASLAACGKEITSIIKSNNQSGIEVLHKASVSDKGYNPAKCNLLVCKGLQLEDNLHNLQSYFPGQEVEIKVWTRIPHKGWVNLAIVDPKTLMLIGEPLASFETDSVSGFSEKMGLGEMVDMEFNITIPKLFPRCSVAGDCVLQWTWFGRVVKQTYESCIDFTVAMDPIIHSEVHVETDLSQKKLVE